MCNNCKKFHLTVSNIVFALIRIMLWALNILVLYAYVSKFLSSREEIEREKAEKETTCEQYREELAEVENMMETSKNDLFTLKTDAIQQKEEQENQLRDEIAHIDQNISKC